MFRTASRTPARAGRSRPAPFNADFSAGCCPTAPARVPRRRAPARPDRLRIDWIDPVSYANELETCMYLGAVKDGSGGIRGWRDFGSAEEAVSRNAFLVSRTWSC